MSAVIFQTQSVLIVALLLYGVSLVIGKTKNKYRHMKFMKVAIVWDILLILQIEFTRGAIAKASKAMENTIILNVHVLLALTTVLLYGFIYWSGNKLHLGEEDRRRTHKTLGFIALTTRIATLITSFLVL